VVEIKKRFRVLGKTAAESLPHIQRDARLRPHQGMSQEGMMTAVTEEACANPGHCKARFSGEYPIELDSYWQDRDKPTFQGAWSADGVNQ